MTIALDKFVLSTFKDNLFALTHAYIFAISVILSTIKSCLLPVQNERCVLNKQDRYKQFGYL